MCVFHLQFLDPPEPPSNPPEVLDVTKSSVSLSWSRPKDDGGSRVTGYYIERRETSTDKWVRHNKTQITTTMYTVTGLVPDAEYQFRIIAQNDVGLSETSPASEPVVCKDRSLYILPEIFYVCICTFSSILHKCYFYICADTVSSMLYILCLTLRFSLLGDFFYINTQELSYFFKNKIFALE